MKRLINLSKIRFGMSVISLVLVLGAIVTIVFKGFNWD